MDCDTLRKKIPLCPNQYQTLLRPSVILESLLPVKSMETTFTTKVCCSDQDVLGIAHFIVPFLSANKEKGENIAIQLLIVKTCNFLNSRRVNCSCAVDSECS